MSNSFFTIIKPGALAELDTVIQKIPGTFPQTTLVCDPNTYRAAGMKIIDNSQGSIELVIIDNQSSILFPNEHSIGELFLKIPDNTELIIACGSGVINDITRFAAYKLAIPYICVATACSMDGYASTISPLVLNNLKRSYPALPPKCILADTDILVNAPFKMTGAGFGDIIGKVIAKMDWHLSNTINNENINKNALELMDIAVERCIDLVSNMDDKGAEKNNPELVEALMDGLITAGKSMTIAGNSRPASASEHLISHFLGMKSLFKQAPHHLHGTKVAYGTFKMAELYWKVFSMNFSDFRKIIEGEVGTSDLAYKNRWEKYIKKAYGPLGEEKFNKWKGVRPDQKRITFIISTLESKWDYICQLVNQFIPPIEQLKEMYNRIGLPYTHNEMGYTDSIEKEAMLCAKDFDYVNKYSLLHLLDELKILEKLIQE